jgi:hypothetical protein
MTGGYFFANSVGTTDGSGTFAVTSSTLDRLPGLKKQS